MDIIKTEHINDLLDVYKELLTKKQQEIMDMYFLYDLSLSEIANECNISRSAVYDLIKRVTKTLENYEEKLQIIAKKEKILQTIKNLDKETKKKIEEIL